MREDSLVYAFCIELMDGLTTYAGSPKMQADRRSLRGTPSRLDSIGLAAWVVPKKMVSILPFSGFNIVERPWQGRGRRD